MAGYLRSYVTSSAIIGEWRPAVFRSYMKRDIGQHFVLDFLFKGI